MLFALTRLCSITPAFAGLSSTKGYVPTCYSAVCYCRLTATVQLACLKHAASVRPGPGSNPQKKLIPDIIFALRLKSSGSRRCRRKRHNDGTSSYILIVKVLFRPKIPTKSGLHYSACAAWSKLISCALRSVPKNSPSVNGSKFAHPIPAF